MSDFKRNQCEREASRILAQSKVSSLPVDPIQLARDAKIGVEALPSSLAGVSGILLFDGGSFKIGYATNIANRGFQQFSVAHELGHYYLPGHPDAVLLGAGGMHTSHADYTSNDRYEREADQFAAALLMPEALLRPLINVQEAGLAAVEALSSKCETSLTSSAIRYVSLTDDPVVMVVSRGGRVDYSFVSSGFRSLRVGRWLKKGDAIPPKTLTEQLNRRPDLSAQGHRANDETDINTWFHDGPDCTMIEEVVGLGSYQDRILTVLTFEFEDEDSVDTAFRPTFR